MDASTNGRFGEDESVNYADLDLDYDRINLYEINNSDILIASLNDEYMKNLKRHFSQKAKNYQFMPSYRSGQWDGLIRFLKSNGVLPRGLLQECVDKLEEWGYKYELAPELQTKEVDLSNFEKTIQKELIAKQEKKLEPWEHQWETAKALLKIRRGITRSATSAGKSYTITMMMKYLMHHNYVDDILLVVPRSDLVIQFQRDMLEYGVDESDIGLYFGDVKDEERPITIATWQTIQNVKSKKFFERFEALFVDEVHGSGSGDKKSKSKRNSGGTQMRQICDKCINASWRFGLTGSLPKDELDLKTIISGIGPVINEIKAKTLMEKGHVSKLKVIIPFISYDKKIVNEKMKHILLDEYGVDENTKKEDIAPATKFNAEKKFLQTYIPRMKLISKIVKSRLQKDENILILASSVKFGENLTKVLEHLLKDDINEINHVYGKMEKNERAEIREDMEKQKRVVIVATTSLFSTGISIKNLHSVVFGDMGKSEITVLQSIGRSLRLHKSKDCARVYDICDNLKYSARHAKGRMELYGEEDFDIKIMEVDL